MVETRILYGAAKAIQRIIPRSPERDIPSGLKIKLSKCWIRGGHPLRSRVDAPLRLE